MRNSRLCERERAQREGCAGARDDAEHFARLIGCVCILDEEDWRAGTRETMHAGDASARLWREVEKSWRPGKSGGKAEAEK